MAIIPFNARDEAEMRAVYARLPEPKPTWTDFYTYVFEHGLLRVKQQDPQRVARAAQGAMDAMDARKFYR